MIELACPYAACASRLVFARDGWWRCPKCKGAIFVRLTEKAVAKQAGDDIAWEYPMPLDAPLAEFNPNHDMLGRFATGGGAMAADTGGGGGGSGAKGKDAFAHSVIGMPDELPFKPSEEDYDSATAYAQSKIDEFAAQTGVSSDDVFEQCDSNLQDMMGDPPAICIRVPPSVIVKVLDKDDSIKNQFETRKSNGAYDPRLRTDCENRGIGIPLAAVPQEHPVYGYLRTGLENQRVMAQYGTVEVELKPQIALRTSMTCGDSLSLFQDRTFVPGGRDASGQLRKARYSMQTVSTPVTMPGHEAWDNMVGRLYNRQLSGEYLEAQIQGGVRREDIRRITVKMKHYTDPAKAEADYARIQKKATPLGIEVLRDDTSL